MNAIPFVALLSMLSSQDENKPLKGSQRVQKDRMVQLHQEQSRQSWRNNNQEKTQSTGQCPIHQPKKNNKK
jgi:hypothetical protein